MYFWRKNVAFTISLRPAGWHFSWESLHGSECAGSLEIVSLHPVLTFVPESCTRAQNQKYARVKNCMCLHEFVIVSQLEVAHTFHVITAQYNLQKSKFVLIPALTGSRLAPRSSKN